MTSLSLHEQLGQGKQAINTAVLFWGCFWSGGGLHKNSSTSGLTTMGYTFSKIIVKSKGGESRAGAVATWCQCFYLFLFFCLIIFSMWLFHSCFLSHGHKTGAPSTASHPHSKYEEEKERKGWCLYQTGDTMEIASFCFV